jgi:hypothetical protein
VVGEVDVAAVVDRIDIDAVVQRVDVEAIVEETDLGPIIAASTSGFASETLDSARTGAVGVDTIVTRVVDRLMRRRGEAPLGPPLLVPDPQDPDSEDARAALLETNTATEASEVPGRQPEGADDDPPAR